MDIAWAEAEAYQYFIGRWSTPVAAAFLQWLDVAPGLRWLDVGCGAGALTSQVLADCEPHSVLGVDRSPQFVEWAAAHVRDRRATFVVGDAMQLPAGVADVAVSGLVLNFVPDAAVALQSMRAAAPDGLIAAYVWDYSGHMQMISALWDAAVQLDPAAIPLAEQVQFAICKPDALEALWRATGLSDVRSIAIDTPTVFTDFDDYWKPFLGGQGPAPSYVMSLDDGRRDALRDLLHEQLPIDADGSISLTARAWAVCGRVAI